MLKEIRSSVEAAEAAAVIHQVPAPLSVTITPIRCGTYLSLDDIARLRRGESLQLALAEPVEPVEPVEPLSEPPSEPVDTTVDDATIVVFPARRAEPEPA